MSVPPFSVSGVVFNDFSGTDAYKSISKDIGGLQENQRLYLTRKIEKI